MKTVTTYLTLFVQLVKLLPKADFEVICQTHEAGKRKSNATKFTAWDHLVALLFSHVAGCDSLREIDDGLYSSTVKNDRIDAHPLKRTTLAYANKTRSYEIFKDFYFALLKRFEKNFPKRLAQQFQQPVYSLDSTTITLCMNLFPWARYTSTNLDFSCSAPKRPGTFHYLTDL